MDLERVWQPKTVEKYWPEDVPKAASVCVLDSKFNEVKKPSAK
jgi:hypothetical protein